MRRSPCASLHVLISTSALLLASPVAAQTYGGGGEGIGYITSSNAGPNPLNGLNINDFVGADRFYNAGYTGTRTVVGNVEAGHIWNGHESLSHVNTFVQGNGPFPAGQLGQFDFHATWVGQTIAGRTGGGAPNANLQEGIAHGATLWSGAIATTWLPVGNRKFATSFNFNSGFAFATPYQTFMQNGIAGRTADVINSSWGFTNPGGYDEFAGTIDGLTQANRKIVVISAGNAGPNPNTVGSPGAGFNSIVVGATSADTSNPAYSNVASFSSRSPQDYQGPDGFAAGARARVDILAPGANMTLAFYGGTTGGNADGTDPTAGSGAFYSSNQAGTSFAAPVVAGGAALLVDAAYDRFTANIANAIDGNVVKAVLLNSADKLAGWNNGQTVVNDVVTTTQALDFAQGAGQMNLDKAFDQYLGGVTDVAGTSGGTDLGALGWDWGTVNENQFNDYVFSQQLLGGSNFTATLNWYVHTVFAGVVQEGQGTPQLPTGSLLVGDDNFTNLALELYRVTDTGDILTAISNAAFINTEHFSFAIPETGNYKLRVNWMGERYDLGSNDTTENYGLAWSGTFAANATAPEPGALSFLILSVPVAGVLYRRRLR